MDESPSFPETQFPTRTMGGVHVDQVGSGEAERPVHNSHCSQHSRPSHPTQLIYDAFSSKWTHFRSPLQDMNYLKELICITVVGRCLTRKHSGLSAVSIQGELWIFFLTQLSTSERGVGWVEKPSIRCIFRKSHFDLLGVVGFGNMLTNDFYLNIFLQLRKKILC